MNTPEIKPQSFDVYQEFSTPIEAGNLCMAQTEPDEAFFAIILANLRMGEAGFAKEMISEMESYGLI